MRLTSTDLGRNLLGHDLRLVVGEYPRHGERLAVGQPDARNVADGEQPIVFRAKGLLVYVDPARYAD